MTGSLPAIIYLLACVLFLFDAVLVSQEPASAPGAPSQNLTQIGTPAQRAIPHVHVYRGKALFVYFDSLLSFCMSRFTSLGSAPITASPIQLHIRSHSHQTPTALRSPVILLRSVTCFLSWLVSRLGLFRASFRS